MPKSDLYQVGSFSFDSDDGVLRDTAGSKTILRPQSRHVLRTLVDARGELVSKDQLMEVVWPHTHVTDDSLVQCISEIRKALGSDSPLLITVPRKGYRLNAEEAAGRETRRRRWRVLWAAGILLLSVLAGFVATLPFLRGPPPADPHGYSPVIAVLPFRDLGPEPFQYFSDGLTEDLIMALSRVSGLRALAPASVFGFRETPGGVGEIAAELGADFVVEGNIRRLPDGIRINAYMTDPTSGERIWSESFDRAPDEAVQLQDDVVRQIVAALSIELRAGELAERSATETVDARAYDLLLRGLDHYRRFSPDDNLVARDLFRQAIDVDPGFARAYADLALTYVWELQLTRIEDPDAVVRQGHSLARHALALDNENIYGLFALSIVSRTLGEHDAAVSAAERIVEINPGFADGYALLALAHNYRGSPEEGLKAIDFAVRLNPRVPFFYNFIEGQSYYLVDDFEGAARRLEYAREQNPEYVPTRKLLAATYVALGKQDAADWEAVEIVVRQPEATLAQERLGSPYRDEVIFLEYVERLKAAGLSFSDSG